MFKHITKFSIIFSILVFASCSQSENQESQGEQSNVASTTAVQTPKKDIPYPSLFSDKDIPMIDGAFVLNKKELKNTKNKTGLQLWERTDKNFEDVKTYYLDILEKNGWERRTDADKQSTKEQEADKIPVRYFVTKFHKEMTDEKKRYVLLLNVTSGNEGHTTIIKILKEM